MSAKKESLKSKVFSGLIWRFGERITAQLVSTIVSIILARLLLPEDYGVVTMTLVFINIANVFVTGSFGNALIQKKEVDNVDFSSVFFFNLSLSILIYFCLFLASSHISLLYEMPELEMVLKVLGLRIPLAAINSVQQAYVSRNMLFKRFFWATLFGTILSGFVGVFLAYRGAGVWALVAQYLTNTTIDTLILWLTVKWRPILVFSWTRAKTLIEYGWKLLCSSLLSTIYEELRTMIIGKYYTSSDLAFYNQGDKYPKLIINNVNTTISSVLFPAISQVQDDRNKVKQMTRRAIQVSSYIIWPMMVGMAVVAEPFVSLLLTEKWLFCVPYLQIFCLSYGLYPIHTANLEALKAIGRSDLYLKLEVAKKIIGLSILVLCIKGGPIMIAWSVLLSSLSSGIVNATPNTKLLNYSYKEQFWDSFPSLILSAFMAMIIYPISYLAMPDYLILALQIFSGCVVYLFLSIITKQPSFNYLKSIIFKKFKNKRG